MNPLAGLPLGEALRDETLDTHRVTHAEDIAKVRVALLVACRVGGLVYLTADDASEVADQMGLPGGERRWLGAVFKGWSRVKATDRTLPSRLPRRHHRRLTVWAVVPEEE